MYSWSFTHEWRKCHSQGWIAIMRLVANAISIQNPVMRKQLEYLSNKHTEDFYIFLCHSDRRGRWSNSSFLLGISQSIMDHACFGDFISFDTTFQTSKSEIAFAPLLGTNHHRQTITFGYALLFNETTKSFIWLFETFIMAISSKRSSTSLLIKTRPWHQ